jgi:hypothetical protein
MAFRGKIHSFVLLAGSFGFSLFLASSATAQDAAAQAQAAGLCGNGVVDAGEHCDPGSPLGSPDCDTTCRPISFEPAGLPFGVPMSALTAETPEFPLVFNPGLSCRSSDVRDGARLASPVVVRYRIHLCRNANGVDAFTEQQVRAVMAKAAAEFAKGGITLQEEALVRFNEADCQVPLESTAWSDALVDATPPGVLALTFVSRIASITSQFSVGGFCYFFGPICVNAGAYETLVIHELGHFFGLAHTFECEYGKETASTCGNTGDLLCDTPPDRGPSGVAGIAQCKDGSILNGSCSGSCGAKLCSDGSKPDSYDWMSYYHCTPGHFSNEQRDFMRCTLDHEMRTYNWSLVTGATTTTTTTSTTTTTTTTSTTTTIAPTTTTLPEPPACGDVNDDGELTAADALAVLRAGVGSLECEDWQCDYDGSGRISAVDALEVLKAAVGAGRPPACPEP